MEYGASASQFPSRWAPFASAPRHLWILMSRTSSPVIENMFICNYKFAISQRPPLARASAETCRCMHIESINLSARLWIHVRAYVPRRKISPSRTYACVERAGAEDKTRRRESKTGCVGSRDQREAMWVECLRWSQDREKIVSLSRDFVCRTAGQMKRRLIYELVTILILHHAPLICCWLEWGKLTRKFDPKLRFFTKWFME
jgi:hypothetical protein